MRVRVEGGIIRQHGQDDLDVSGVIFTLVQDYQVSSSGGYIMVSGRGVDGFDNRTYRVRVPNPASIVRVDSTEQESTETDDEIIERMRDRFEMLNEMTRAAKMGSVRALIVTGPPGVGKSHGVEEVLERYDTAAFMSGSEPKYEVCKGNLSALGLYCKLYEYRSKDSVLVFDDCDSILLDDLSLNILKAALDSKERRRLSWNTDSRKLNEEGIPNSFEFEGSVIFITNIQFSSVRSKKLKDHLEAIESRCHYIDLDIRTGREKMLRIRQVISDGMLDDRGFSDETVAEIIDFVDDNRSRLRELSLRTVVKTADLVAAFPKTWKRMALTTLTGKGVKA